MSKNQCELSFRKDFKERLRDGLSPHEEQLMEMI